MVKRLPAMLENQVQSLGWEDSLGMEMATHSSTLAWEIQEHEDSILVLVCVGILSPSFVCRCSVVKSRLTLCNPTDHSMPGSLVLHCLLAFAHIHVYWVGDAL